MPAVTSLSEVTRVNEVVVKKQAVLVVGSDLAQQHPFLSFQIRANYRHHQAHIYVVTPKEVREDKYSAASVRVGADYFAALKSSVIR